MNIAVLEWDLSKIGGRQQTMVSGFADYFASLGHNVDIYSNFLSSNVTDYDNILDYHIADNLTIDNFNFGLITRQWTPYIPIKRIADHDFVLLPNPGMSWLTEHMDTPVIAWYIAHSDRWNFEPLHKLWTNSYTTQKELKTDAPVIYPPHNYSIHRESALPWDERKIDIVLATALTKSREITVTLEKEIEFANGLAKKYNVLGLFIIKDDRDYEMLENVEFEFFTNVKRRDVAKFMAASKVFLHMSPLESCSLAVYESLNAGCYPIIREAGAAQEQLGDVGHIYNDEDEAYLHVEEILKGHYDINKSIKRGEKFDRRNNKTLVRELQEISILNE